jgi:hypothetical protein
MLGPETQSIVDASVNKHIAEVQHRVQQDLLHAGTDSIEKVFSKEVATYFLAVIVTLEAEWMMMSWFDRLEGETVYFRTNACTRAEFNQNILGQSD